MYGSKYRALNKKIKMKVTEVRMLRRMCGVTRSDKNKNECMRWCLGGTNIN